MKTLLMHPDRDFDATPPSRPDPAGFSRDIGLDVLLAAAAGEDRYLRDIMAAAWAGAWANDAVTIRYRQDVLKDCLANPAIVRQLYAIAIEPFGRERSWDFSLYGRDASAKVGSSVRTLRCSLILLRRLRDACMASAARFRSIGFRQFFATLARDLDDAYLATAAADLENLTFRKGVLLSARVGDGGKGVGTMLRKPRARDLGWLRTLPRPGFPSYTIHLHPRDDAGAQAFAELRNRGLGLVADALYQSAQHVLGFLRALRAELAFYLGCLNLADQLGRIGEAVAFPDVAGGRDRLHCRNLRDPCLGLSIGRPAVGNDVEGDGRPLIVITGANRGGKTTFLRSVGLAQLMMQAGMFVTADAYVASLHTGLFSHYKREEDRTMRSGKFDEELARMSAIADRIHRGAMVLFNEPFAATHEQEGSEVARQITAALLENDVTVLVVTHMYELARAFLDDDRAVFLRADRNDGAARAFRLREAKPLPKSLGTDLYRQIFGETA